MISRKELLKIRDAENKGRGGFTETFELSGDIDIIAKEIKSAPM